MQGPELYKPFFLSCEALQMWRGMIDANASNPVIPTELEHVDHLIELHKNFPKIQKCSSIEKKLDENFPKIQKCEPTIEKNLDFSLLCPKKSDFILDRGQLYHPGVVLPIYEGF